MIFDVSFKDECWTGPDDSKYDKDGPSNDCVGFGMDECKKEDELCAGKSGSNFVYYVDVPEHTKSAEEAKKEMEELKKKEEERKKKAEEAKKKKAAAKKLKKSKSLLKYMYTPYVRAFLVSVH